MVILDIFIGLVLVYFLYSLLASIIAEMFATWVGMRARILRQGIDNLLNDKKPAELWFDFAKYIKDLFLVEPRDFRFSKAGQFYKQPSVKYLGKVGEDDWWNIRNKKPSYISRDNYILTTLNMLSNSGLGNCEWDKIKFSLEKNSLNLEPDTLKMFRDFVMRSNDSYKNFITLIGDSFDDMMDRVNGWYKRKISVLLFILGLFMAIMMNVDTFQITSILSNKAEVRNGLVNLAKLNVDAADTAVAQKPEYQKAQYKKTINQITEMQNLIGNGWDMKESKFLNYESRIINLTNFILFKKERDSIRKNNLDKIKAILKKQKLGITDIDTIGAILKIKLLSISKQDTQRKQAYFVYDKIGWDKIGHIAKESLPNKQKFWGFLITALALSLGAQFWFDLLKKLVALRGAGVKPDEQLQNTKSLSNPTRIDSDGLSQYEKNPITLAINSFRPKWEKITGFVAANPKFDNNAIEKYIEVMFEQNKIPSNFPKTISQTIDNETINIPIKTIIGEKAKLGMANGVLAENAIYQPATNSSGTAAAIVKNIRTGQSAILTCGHVVRSDSSAFVDNEKSAIDIVKNGMKIRLGFVKNSVMSIFCDAGIVEFDKKNEHLINHLPKITKYRNLSENECDSTLLTINTLGGIKTGILKEIGKYHTFTDTLNPDIRYYDLFTIASASNPAEQLTKGGDSGALIVDSTNTPVGILVGASKVEGNWVSYGMKLSDIFEIMQLQKF